MCSSDLNFHLQTDGAGAEYLIVPDGGARNPTNEQSFIMEDFEEGISRTRLHEKMDGGAIFSFALINVPKSLNILLDNSLIKKDDVDYLLLHQANKFMCNQIRKKMKIEEIKVPSNIKDFGNTSGASYLY